VAGDAREGSHAVGERSWAVGLNRDRVKKVTTGEKQTNTGQKPEQKPTRKKQSVKSKAVKNPILLPLGFL
jgi:hypothetical protein